MKIGRPVTFKCGGCGKTTSTVDVVHLPSEPEVIKIMPSEWVHERDDETGAERICCETCGGAMLQEMMKASAR